MLIYTGLAFVIFALRIGTVKQGEPFQLLSREGGIVANNIFLSVILAVILIGTLYPIAAEALGDKISVGPPYFNKATVPIAVLLMLALLVGPLLRWRRDGLGRLKYWLIGAAAILLLSCLATWKFAPEIGIFPLLGIALSSALAVAAWMPLRGRKLLRTPIPVFGMVIAHFGLAVSVFGMAAESGFSSETLTALAPGESAKVAGWEVKLNDVNPVVGDNWVAVEGEMIAAKNGNEFALHPQSRQFFKPPMQTSEAALLTRWNGQLYVVIAQPDQEGDGRWQVRLWWKPFVTFIWYGAILIALGGAIALLGRMGRRTKKPAINTWQAE
jgi:cytochrome c-type biogenesis protein CcmF